MAGHNPYVVNVINSLTIGGAEKLLCRFVEDCRRRLHCAVDVVTIYRHDRPADPTGRAGALISLNINRKYDMRIPFQLGRVFRKGKYRIVHAHLFPASLFIAVVSLLANKKIHFIFTEHNVFNRRRTRSWFRIFDRLIYSRYEKIVCVSDTVRHELLQWIPQLHSKTVVIRNGIPIPGRQRRIGRKYDIIFVGRLTTAKGLDVLLRAVSELKPNALVKRAAIVGQGPLLPFLKAEVHRLEIDDTVHFLGARDDVNELLAQSKIFILPSRWEGLPLSMLEAMASGLPVVATNVGGIPEVIVDGVNGILVPPSSPGRLAEAIARLVSNRRLALELGQNARRHIEQHYSIRLYSENMLKLYDAVLRAT
ncbi:glycosyltransferase [candidate division WOR-3 bacterium]|nr:glycosyltransferase [candidate division WOR-3 bacterium]